MSVVVVDEVSRWFGDQVAVNAVSMSIGPGITALLGPNGAGKSTLLSMIAGFLPCSTGTITVAGHPTGSTAARRATGLVLDLPRSYEHLTAAELVGAVARLHGVSAGRADVEATLDLVDMAGSSDARLATCSQGMRQRVHVAAALVHRPDVLLLDEPFNGLDPSQRARLADVVRDRAADGATVVVSSHVLDEVDALASRIEVLVGGRHAASGDRRAIRSLLADVPRRFEVEGPDVRTLTAALVATPSVTAVRIVSPTVAEVEVTDPQAFAHALPRLARREGHGLVRLTATDDSLEDTFALLAGGRP